jgi:hypothetical protein
MEASDIVTRKINLISERKHLRNKIPMIMLPINPYPKSL